MAPESIFNTRAPWWLPGGNAQTIWPALFGRSFAVCAPQFSRERWTTPDGDFIDVDHLVGKEPAVGSPRLVLFHGLEGSSGSHYAQAFADQAARMGWAFCVPHFRGCSGELNLAPRAYHSGDHEEIHWVLARLREQEPMRPMLAVGVSLGGNALLRWAQEMGRSSNQWVSAVAAVSAPVDLGAAGRAIDRGFNRLVYARMFLRTMVRKAEAKWQQFPGLFDLDSVRRARTLHEFDDLFTAPLHGFKSVDDYWSRAAAKPRLTDIALPALVLNARNDPFVPAGSLPGQADVGRWVTLAQPAHGGHVGFPEQVAGAPWCVHVQSMPAWVAGWLASVYGCGKCSVAPVVQEGASAYAIPGLSPSGLREPMNG
jgi:hypothetical protein